MYMAKSRNRGPLKQVVWGPWVHADHQTYNPLRNLTPRRALLGFDRILLGFDEILIWLIGIEQDFSRLHLTNHKAKPTEIPLHPDKSD